MRGRNEPLRLGVLPPGSNAIPFLAADIMAALERGFAGAGVPVHLIAEFAGCNASQNVVQSRVQQLVVSQRVACIVAPLNVSLIEKLAGTFENSGVPLVALNLGEDPLFETARHPYVFVNEFRLWRAAWMCGYWGAKQFGPRGASLVSFHEAGYHLNFAFQLGLEAAGGVLLQSAVTHQQASTDDPSAQIAEVTGRAPDFVWAGYSAKEAVSFISTWSSRGLRIPLVGLPPLVDDRVRAAVGTAANDIHLIAPAPAAAPGDSSRPYIVLATEAAALIAAAVQACGAAADPPEFLTALRHAEADGPRGRVRFDDGREWHEPVYVRTAGLAETAAVPVDVPPLLDEQYRLACRTLSKQGWTNPYLCT